MIRPSSVTSLKDYFEWIATRWIIATLFMAFLGGASAVIWFVKTSAEGETQRIAAILGHAYRPQILMSAYRDAQTQMRESGEISATEGLGILNINRKVIYEDEGTSHLKTCAGSQSVCWSLRPIRISTSVPIYFDESTKSDVVAQLAVTLEPRYDATSVIVFGSILILGFLMIGVLFSNNLKFIGETLLSVINQWNRRILALDGGHTTESKFLFRELIPLDEEISNLDKKIKALENDAAKNGANLARFDLLRGLGHDLKTPISQLSKFVAILFEKQKQGLPISEVDGERVRNTLKTLRRLIDSIQDTTRINRNQETSTELSASIRQYCQSINDGIGKTRVSFSNTNQTAHVRMSDIDLYRVLNNLTQNALETDERTQVTISLKQSKDNVQICISDDGPGIPTNIRAKIFEAEFTTKPTRGTGLGLSIVKNIIEQHGGSVGLDEALTGTSISIALPRVTLAHEGTHSPLFQDGAVL